jgi:hypothetical protein
LSRLRFCFGESEPSGFGLDDLTYREGGSQLLTVWGAPEAQVAKMNNPMISQTILAAL